MIAEDVLKAANLLKNLRGHSKGLEHAKVTRNVENLYCVMPEACKDQIAAAIASIICRYHEEKIAEGRRELSVMGVIASDDDVASERHKA